MVLPSLRVQYGSCARVSVSCPPSRACRHLFAAICFLCYVLCLDCRPLLDSSGRAVILCHTPKREYVRKLLYDPLPIESHLDHVMAEHMNAEVPAAVPMLVACMAVPLLVALAVLCYAVLCYAMLCGSFLRGCTRLADALLFTTDRKKCCCPPSH